MLRCRSCIPIILTLALAGCEPADQTPDAMDGAAVEAFTDADRTAIESASERWVAAAGAGAWDEVAGLYTEDAVMMPPNMQTGRGRAAVREQLGGFPPIESISFDRVHIDGSGHLAYVHGNYSMTFALPDGTTMDDRGKYIEIWERQADGQWRITRDIFNSDLPAPGS